MAWTCRLLDALLDSGRDWNGVVATSAFDANKRRLINGRKL